MERSPFYEKVIGAIIHNVRDQNPTWSLDYMKPVLLEALETMVEADPDVSVGGRVDLELDSKNDSFRVFVAPYPN